MNLRHEYPHEVQGVSDTVLSTSAAPARGLLSAAKARVPKARSRQAFWRMLALVRPHRRRIPRCRRRRQSH